MPYLSEMHAESVWRGQNLSDTWQMIGQLFHIYYRPFILCCRWAQQNVSHFIKQTLIETYQKWGDNILTKEKFVVLIFVPHLIKKCSQDLITLLLQLLAYMLIYVCAVTSYGRLAHGFHSSCSEGLWWSHATLNHSQQFRLKPSMTDLLITDI